MEWQTPSGFDQFLSSELMKEYIILVFFIVNLHMSKIPKILLQVFSPGKFFLYDWKSKSLVDRVKVEL